MSFLATVADAEARYGKIINNIWADERKWMMIMKPLIQVELALTNTATGHPTGTIYLNKDLYDPLSAALDNIVKRNLLSELHSFDGCFHIRDIRGMPGKLSAHAYGLAIDINANTNKLGTPGDMDMGIVQCFTSAGFVWGGDFKRQDNMHFQFCGW